MMEETLTVILGLFKSVVEDLDDALDRIFGDIVEIDAIEAVEPA